MLVNRELQTQEGHRHRVTFPRVTNGLLLAGQMAPPIFYFNVSWLCYSLCTSFGLCSSQGTFCTLCLPPLPPRPTVTQSLPLWLFFLQLLSRLFFPMTSNIQSWVFPKFGLGFHAWLSALLRANDFPRLSSPCQKHTQRLFHHFYFHPRTLPSSIHLFLLCTCTYTCVYAFVHS